MFGVAKRVYLACWMELSQKTWGFLGGGRIYQWSIGLWANCYSVLSPSFHDPSFLIFHISWQLTQIPDEKESSTLRMASIDDLSICRLVGLISGTWKVMVTILMRRSRGWQGEINLDLQWLNFGFVLPSTFGEDWWVSCDQWAWLSHLCNLHEPHQINCCLMCFLMKALHFTILNVVCVLRLLVFILWSKQPAVQPSTAHIWELFTLMAWMWSNYM